MDAGCQPTDPVQELRPVTSPARPWTRFYPPGTAPELGPLKYPHMPAAIRDASATYAKQPASRSRLPNGSRGSITFEETDRLSDQFAVYFEKWQASRPAIASRSRCRIASPIRSPCSAR